MKHFFTVPSALLLGLALLASPKADAQQFSKRKQYNSVGVSLNAMNYFGDLVPKVNFTSLRPGATRPNVGLSITRRFYPRISGRLALAYGRITGDDSKGTDPNDPNARFRYHRNMNFVNDIFEGSGVVIVDLIENRNNYLKRPDFVPYLFVGVAGFHHNPRGQVKADKEGGTAPTAAGSPAVGSYVNLQPLATEGVSYGLWQMAIPFGGGLRYRINRNFDASIEIGWRKTFTDYLDDVSGNYVDRTTLGSPAAQYFGHDITRTDDGVYNGFNTPGAPRGNKGVDGSNKTDWYVQTGVTLNYILTPRIKNPKFR